ncbi:MAG: phospholipid carrier-dependent glycosyltransferase [Clostridia bacterium]|nr:phospholipid carrier-dependent glycosyltransferase [Clostridia bacterium]
MKKLKEFFSDNTRKMTKRDWIILGIIVLIYTIISFINLGSTKNPQTFAEMRQNNSIIIELEGEAKYILKMRHYSGAETGNYSVYGSKDGINYEIITTYKDKYVFLWEDTVINEELKYLKITANSKESYIGEIALYDENDNLLKLKAEDNKDKQVIDEQDVVPEVIGYMNSVYFDEIYFARSAYEYLNGRMAYEWVHPPLGKLIQMIPITILGMTPFAYRLMGNIAGILMVAVMYIFGKTMLKDSKYALLAGVIMAFDNFHFAQTRMGTVDSFLVLFIMLSALFMFKYLLTTKEDILKEKIKWLFYSGLFFGLSVSVKWTGLYAGLGLCIMFFGKMIKDCIKDRKIDKQYLYIIISCILYFIAIPCAIYVLSYLLFPNVRPSGVGGFSDIFSQIEQMYNYHSKLVAEHSFTSNWYTWPVMMKPVWLHVSYPVERYEINNNRNTEIQLYGG